MPTGSQHTLVAYAIRRVTSTHAREPVMVPVCCLPPCFLAFPLGATSLTAPELHTFQASFNAEADWNRLERRPQAANTPCARIKHSNPAFRQPTHSMQARKKLGDLEIRLPVFVPPLLGSTRTKLRGDGADGVVMDHVRLPCCLSETVRVPRHRRSR